MARESLKLLSVDLSVPDTRRRIQCFVGSATGIWDVAIVPRKLNRTQQQNRYLHGVVFSMIADAMKEAGTDEANIEYAKSFLKDRFLRQEVIDQRTGEVAGYITRDTHTLNIDEMILFINQCIDYALDYWQIEIPSPGEEELASWRK